MEQIDVQSINSIKNKIILQKNKEYDEPLIYLAFGNICFATATFLLGLQNFYSFNPIMLTIYGFFFPGVGQVISSIMAYKYKYYIDGNGYWFFAINWFVCAGYDLFPIFGWMKPLTNIELGIHNLMCTLFVIIFYVQNLLGNSYLQKLSFTSIFFGFVLSTIGNFANSTGTLKAGEIFNIITSIIAYYSGLAMIVNQKLHIVAIPLFDGKKLGEKLE